MNIVTYKGQEIEVYSQYDEEPYILEALYTAPYTLDRRQFLDIGAFHPIDKSNTRRLVERGWQGVMLEPSPGPMKSLLLEYGNNPRISLISAAIGLEPGLVELHVTDDATSTSDEGNYNTWKDASPFLGKMFAPTLTLNQILNRFGSFEFINFDAEGLSVELFGDLVKNTGARPRCVCIEHDARHVEIAQFAEVAGYRRLHTNGTNEIWTYGI